MSEWKSKRFWESAATEEADGGFAVTLDGRPVKTPGKAPLVLPTLGLAQAVAAEWDAQEDQIDPTSMPATRAANSAIEKVTPQRGAVIDALAEYGGSDLLCYRADRPQALVELQAAAWDPHLAWANATLGAELRTTTGVMFTAQPVAALAALRAPLEEATAFELAGLHDLIMLTGSLVLGLRARGVEDPADLWQASRVDEDFQISQWGEDEEATEMAEGKRQAFFAAHRFYCLSRGA